MAQAAVKKYPREYENLVKRAVAQGWRIEPGTRHVRLLGPDGVSAVALSATPSDHRTLENTRAELRRLGVDLGDRPKLAVVDETKVEPPAIEYDAVLQVIADAGLHGASLSVLGAHFAAVRKHGDSSRYDRLRYIIGRLVEASAVVRLEASGSLPVRWRAVAAKDDTGEAKPDEPKLAINNADILNHFMQLERPINTAQIMAECGLRHASDDINAYNRLSTVLRQLESKGHIERVGATRPTIWQLKPREVESTPAAEADEAPVAALAALQTPAAATTTTVVINKAAFKHLADASMSLAAFFEEISR